jgi:large subunit ribosomal protein L23
VRSIYDVIRRPVISEKSAALAEVANRHVFEVSMKANKYEVKDAVQRLFNVKVEKVRTCIMHGKVKRAGKGQVRRPNWKKAVVTLSEGQELDFFQEQE